MTANTTVTVERLELARLPSGTEVTTYLHRFDGDRDGPTVYLEAAVHGREINGVEAIRRVSHELAGRELSGEVRIVPVANPLTFDLQRYMLPDVLDYTHLWTANMERTWPGDPDGSLHERMSATLWEYVEDADAVIDLHTGSQDTYPHTIYTEGQPDSRDLAQAFGTDLVMPSGASPRSPDWPTHRDVTGTLRSIANREGIPSMIAELGDAYRIDEPVVDIGVTGVLNVLRYLGVLDDEPEENGTGTLAVHDRDTGSFAATNSGLFVTNPEIELGQTVSPGDRLGTLYHPTKLEKIQDVVPEREGVVYYLRKRGTVTAGERVAALAFEE